jgi:hypothetical protein
MDEPKKSVGEVMEEYNKLHNVPPDVTGTITHEEFVLGLKDKSVGFAPKGGQPIRLVSGVGRVFFVVCVIFYLGRPILVIPLWAHHEHNWWLLLGIVVACVIAPQLAQRKENLIGGVLFLGSLVFLSAKGFHNAFTFLFLCALWSYFFFQLAQAVQIEYARNALIASPELFRREIAENGLYIWRKRNSAL